jgi:hypothetical protein
LIPIEIHSRSLSFELTVSASRSRRSAAAARAVQGPGDSAGAPGAEKQAHCVWIVSFLSFVHIFADPALKTDSDLSALCMAPAYSESDTQDFGKSCVSLLLIGLSIHKSLWSGRAFAAPDVKNVYKLMRIRRLYTNDRAGEKSCDGAGENSCRRDGFLQRGARMF